MIHEFIDHLDIEPEFSSMEIVDRLAKIDLTRDVVICYNPMTKDGKSSRVISHDIDQFVISNHEQYKTSAINNILTYKTFPRVKISLPNGLFPDFSSSIKGLSIRNIAFDKMEGIELDETLELQNAELDLGISAEHGRYSFYHNFEISYGVFDQQLYSLNKFTGNYLPIGTRLCNLRLLPHFIGMSLGQMELNNIYIICSKYIYSRLPNF